MLTIKQDSLSDGAVIQLLTDHLQDMHELSPPESVHALDTESLLATDIVFYSGWHDGILQGCVALKRLNENHAELKSMRTHESARNKGVGSALLQHVLRQALAQGFTRLSLETGTHSFFKPAHRLYEKFGFQDCAPFAGYHEDPHSRFMTLTLDPEKTGSTVSGV